MQISFIDFLNDLSANPILIVTTLLTLGVILVNGWTDAPNAIATSISTRSIKPRNAIVLASFFNFLGVLVMTTLNSLVAQTIYNMVDFGGDSKKALIALCAALISIVLWSTTSWWFGIPTSESHALIAGITGAAIAIHRGLGGINLREWANVVYGLILSLVLGFITGWVTVKLIGRIFRKVNRTKTTPLFKNAQVLGSAGMAFMHGAQDGQKFMGVFMLGVFLAKGQSDVPEFNIPLWLIVICSAVMAFGTSVGGYRIIKSVGMDMVKLEKYQGFSADLAGIICLLIASVFGLPVSTTHTKTTAIMGVGAAKRVSSVNWGVVREMLSAWVLAFPGCGLLGFLMTMLFMKLF
ncbi:MAG: inorganic phosphate transporter [Clostridium sp.]|nr:inorganic phosphate transporter [Clostridium sp.]